MGRMTAMDIATSDVSLEQQLSWHLAGNHYPPIPQSMIPVCIAAIDAYWEEDYSRMIPLPEGVEFRTGATSVSASQAIESLRLDAWCVED
jgi:hypothetical protein